MIIVRILLILEKVALLTEPNRKRMSIIQYFLLGEAGEEKNCIQKQNQSKSPSTTPKDPN